MNKLIPFPGGGDPEEFPGAAKHRLFPGGGAPMEIRHRHPKYRTEDERKARLKDVRDLCLAALRKQRGEAPERGAGRPA